MAFYNHHIRQHFLAHRRNIALVLLLGLANSCTSFLLTISLGDFFSLQFGDLGTKSRLLHSLGIYLDSYESFAVFFGVLVFIKLVAWYYQQWLGNLQGEIFVKGIREKIFEAQINWTEEQFKEKPFGNYLLRYSNDMKSLQHYLVKGILEGLRNVLFLLLGLLLIMRINGTMALVTTLFLLPAVLCFAWLWQKQRKFVADSRNKRSNMLAYVSKRFSRFTNVKANNREQEVNKQFAIRSEALYIANVATIKNESFIQGLIGILPFLLIGVLLLLIFANVVNITHAHALTVVLVILMMQAPIKAMLKIPGYLNKGQISLQKIDEMVR